MIQVKDISFDFEQENSLFTTIAIGDKSSDGADFFQADFDKDTIYESDEKLLPNFDIYFRRKALFVLEKLDKTLIAEFLTYFIEIFPDEKWEDSTQKLVKYFNWEFENYQA